MATSVYLFVPNLIGYVRIILAVVAFHFANSNYQSPISLSAPFRGLLAWLIKLISSRAVIPPARHGFRVVLLALLLSRRI